MTNDSITCRVLTGPTASGKTALGIRLAAEEGWDILCMDSMQIYRGMNIGTAKPTADEMHGVMHYMMNICDPADTFSVAEYRDRAEKIIREEHERKREFLIVGGTVLYLRALMHPMGMGYVPANPELRARLNEQALTQEGRLALHKELLQIDPATAERLPVNDVRRHIRAIEVYLATGIPFSVQPVRKSDHNEHLSWKVVSTEMDRTILYECINQRVTEMIHNGLKEEVSELLANGVPEDAQSMNGIGYKEMIPCIHGEYSLEEAGDRIRLGTRHYAKRQMTFLRREKDIRYVRTDRENAFTEIRNFLL